MKIYSIFRKNLKTVSRNWVYFVILIICPILLILISGALLNSVNFVNLKVGFVNQDPTYQFDLSSFKYVKPYTSLTDCVYDLTNFNVGMCVFVKEDNGKHNVEIYLDNTKRIAELFVKQFISEKILREQTAVMEQTSEYINSKLSLYSTSIASSKQELNNTFNELDEQEKQLREYHENFTRMKRSFDDVYWRLKALETDIKSLGDRIKSTSESLENNLSHFNSKKQEIEAQISNLKTFLSGKLPADDYSYVSSSLNSILSSLNDISNNLNSLETDFTSPSLAQALDDIDLLFSQLDSLKQLLDNLDKDLQEAIIRTQNAKIRVNNFIAQLNMGEEEIKEISKATSSKNVFVSFKGAFSISQDIVFLSFPLLVSIIIAFTSVVLSNMFILKQTSESSYIREAMSPTRDFSFLLANYLANLFFIAIQISALFLIGFYLFRIDLSNNFYLLTLAIFLASSVFIFIGMSLGYMIKTSSLSMLLAIFAVIILFIFSEVLAPTNLVSPLIKFLIDLNPFVILKDLLFNILILNLPFGSLTILFNRLWTFFAIGLIITYISRKISKENIMEVNL